MDGTATGIDSPGAFTDRRLAPRLPSMTAPEEIP